MLYQKYCNLHVWVWILIIIVILINLSQTICSVKEPISITEIETKAKTETKENMTNNNPIIKVFNFNTSWCGWSKRFQPEWDKFSAEINDPDNTTYANIEAIDVKCDGGDDNKALCEEYKVPGYPFVVVKNNNKPEQYKGERTHVALKNHVLAL